MTMPGRFFLRGGFHSKPRTDLSECAIKFTNSRNFSMPYDISKIF